VHGLRAGAQADEPRRLQRVRSKDRSRDEWRSFRKNRRRRSTNQPRRRVLLVCALAELSLGATGAVERQRRRLSKLRIIGPVRPPAPPAETARAVTLHATRDVRSLGLIDPSTNRVVAWYTVPESCQELAYSDGSIWTAIYDCSRIYRINPKP
jgi:hypothetical protein